MSRTVKFIGAIADQTIVEKYPLYVYDHGQDVQFLDLIKGNTYVLTDEQFRAIPAADLTNGLIQEISEDLGASLKAAGTATFTVDTVTTSPTYGTAPDVIITHNIGSTFYDAVLVDEVNFSIINQSANTIEIKRLSTSPTGPASVGYAIMVTE